MIKFNNITKKYGDTVVIDNCSFTMPLYKTTCILGDSGVGKTTLLNIMANTIELTSGNVENLPKSISYVFQEHRLISNKTVKENLKLFTGEENDQIIQKYLEKVGLLDKENAYVITLSGGEKQRVNLVRAIIKNSDLILLDEPFSSLDLSLKLKLTNVLKNLFKSERKSVALVTHDVNLAVSLADEILVVKDKKIVSFNLLDSADKNSESYEKKVTDKIIKLLT